jgi:broad specificity phosphatase PhoE
MGLPTGLLTARDLMHWREQYDVADIEHARLDAHEVPWVRCIASDLPRAVRTAQQLFAGSIEQTPLLREPHIQQFDTGALRLPQTAWKWALRLSWLTGHRSQRMARDDFQARMNEFEASVLRTANVDTLVVSHAGVMMFLRARLIRLGFQGPRFRMAEHGKLYLFER